MLRPWVGQVRDCFGMISEASYRLPSSLTFVGVSQQGEIRQTLGATRSAMEVELVVRHHTVRGEGRGGV